MARAVTQDPLQTHKFRLIDLPLNLIPAFPANLGFSTGGGIGLGGFKSVTFPEIQAETEEIREGNWPYSRKVLMRATVSAMTLEKGVMPKNSDFFLFATGALFGRALTRRNLFLSSDRPGGEAAKGWILWNAIPTGVKASGDFDASSAEVSVASLTLEVEQVEELPFGFEGF